MSHRLQLLIPTDLDAALNKAARRAQISKGAWVRKAIEAALRLQGKRPGSAVDRLAALGAPSADISKMLLEIDKGRGE